MRSPIKWFGGKSALAERICARMSPHVCYVEVFDGAGWALFHKERSKSEIYNDLNGDLVNLFTILRDRPEDFARRAEFLLPSREEFYRFRAGYRGDDPTWTTLDPVDRAIRFYALVHRSFNTNLRQYKPIRTRALASVDLEMLRDVAKRLQKVWIERLDFEKVTRSTTRRRRSSIIDPPYAPAAFASGVYGWPDEEHNILTRMDRSISEVFDVKAACESVTPTANSSGLIVALDLGPTERPTVQRFISVGAGAVVNVQVPRDGATWHPVETLTFPPSNAGIPVLPGNGYRHVRLTRGSIGIVLEFELTASR